MEKLKEEIAGGAFLVKATNGQQTFTPEDFTEEHLMIQRTARQFFYKEVEKYYKEIEAEDIDVVVDLLKQGGSLGLLGHSISEDYGGLGLDKISSGIVGEAVGGGGGYSVAHANQTCIATFPIMYYGSTAQKEKYLPKLATGEYLGAYCLTEPEAGSDAMGGKTTALLNEAGTHYLLNGTKIYITNAAFSDTFIVYAKVDGKHFTAFIVEKDYPGLSLGPEEKKMGIKGSSTRSVILENCEVPVENVLGEIGRGHIIAFTVLNIGRFNLGFASLGGAKHALKTTVAQILDRKQFGQTIASFGASKEKIAKLTARMFASESLQYRTAYLLEDALGGLDNDSGTNEIIAGLSEYALECAICKVYGSEVLDLTVDEGVQLHGGAGFISEYRIEQMYRNSRISRIFEGTNEVNRLLITGQFLKRSLKGELPYEAAVKTAVQFIKDAQITTDSELLEAVRSIYLLLTDQARKQYGSSLDSKQEILMKLSDLAIHLYAGESVVLRVEKNKVSETQTLLKDTVLEGIWNDVLMIVRQLEGELLKDEEELKQAIYQVLMSKTFTDSMKRNRIIAEEVYEKGAYLY